MSRVQKYRQRKAQFLSSMFISTVVLTSMSVLFFYFLNPVQEKNPSGDLPSLPGVLEDQDPGSIDEQAGSEPIDPTKQVPEPSPQEVSFLFTGDIMLGEKVGLLLDQHGVDYPYEELITYLQSPDFTLGNLETAITTRGVAQDKTYTFRSKPETLKGLKEAGFDILALANNHVLDFGEEGLLDTLFYLDEFELTGTGAGKDDVEAYTPKIVELEGMKIAFFSFSRVVPHVSWHAGKDHPGVATIYDPTRAIAEIAEIQKSVDMIVVQVHWGVELQDKIEEYQREIAYQLIDAGADLIVGTHPHVMQPIEFYKDKLIAYSLGNFVFSTGHAPLTWQTAMLKVTCSPEQIQEVILYPIQNKWARPTLMNEEDRKSFLAYMQEISPGVTITEEGKVEKKPSN